MIRALLLLLLTAAPLHAEPRKVALFTQSNGNSATLAPTVKLAYQALCERAGTPYQVFNASVRTWGESGVDDSTWFREQGFAAAIVMSEGASPVSGPPVTSGPFATSFLNAAGTARVGNSPLSGRWGIPCFVTAEFGVIPSATFNDTSSTSFVAGVTTTQMFKPAVGEAGTWRYRLLYRTEDGRIDTLYGDPGGFNCRPATWAGAGTVRAVGWVDTAFGGSGKCAGTDTTVAMWHYQPRGDRPGVYFSNFTTSFTTGSITGPLWFLQKIYELTDVPRRKILTPLTEHDAYPTAGPNSVGDANIQALYDTLNAHGVRRTIATQLSANGYATLYTPNTITMLRREFARGNRWIPFSNDAGWTLNFVSASDTANVRQAWNQLQRTATHADSFGFAISAYDPRRIVSAAGLYGAWTGKVLADGGVEIVESTISTPQAGGWYLLTGGNGYGQAVPHAVPGVGETRYLHAIGTFGFGHDSTFSRVRGNIAPYEYVGRSWINALGIGATRATSLYWHSGGTLGVGSHDPYFRWLMSVALRHYRFFDRVIGVDSEFTNQAGEPVRASR